jgi:DNA-binding NarL/FixJ family response regulator
MKPLEARLVEVLALTDLGLSRLQISKLLFVKRTSVNRYFSKIKSYRQRSQNNG